MYVCTIIVKIMGGDVYSPPSQAKKPPFVKTVLSMKSTLLFFILISCHKLFVPFIIEIRHKSDYAPHKMERKQQHQSV